MKKVISIVVVMVMLVGMVACSGGGGPKNAVSGYLDSIQKSDFEGAGKFVQGANEIEDAFGDLEDEDEEVQMIVKAITDFKYTIKDVEEIDENTAKVNVDFEVTDYQTVMGDIIGELTTLAFSSPDMDEDQAEEEAMKIMEKGLTAKDRPMTSTSTAITVVKEDKDWKISPDSGEDIINAMMGDLFEVFGGFMW